MAANAVPIAGRPAERRRASVMRRREVTAAAGFLAPAVLIVGVFVAWPLVKSAYLSLTDASLAGTANWVGFDNYIRLLGDPRFLNALQVTLVYTVATTVVSVSLAIGLALLLNRRLPARAFFRSTIFAPFVVSMAVISIVWAFMLDPQIGPIASWLQQIGISMGDGVNDPKWALPAVILVGVWRDTGYFMVIFLGGLQSIPAEVQEAATVDGVRPWQRFRFVTWPLLANTTLFVLVIAAIFQFQAFDQMFVMTNGGPYFQTETLVLLIYNTGFNSYHMGYASAIAWVLAIIILLFSLVQMALFRRQEMR